MAEQKSSEQLTEESSELKRALGELTEWSAERRRTLSEYEGYIQRALFSGRMTWRRNTEPGKKYLTERMIATIVLDCNMLKRSILLMESRERRIRKRLQEIVSVESSTNPPSHPQGEEEKSA